MYHTTKPFTSEPTTHTDSWHNATKPGDVVLFRFPFNEDHKTDKPKQRPCLMLDVIEANGTKFVELAYGTSARTKANTGYEVRVNQPASCEAVGLDRPTRFVCARRVIVSVDHSGFVDGSDLAPLIGRLDAPLVERMNAVCFRLQVEAAPGTKTRRQEQARWPREEHGFLLRNRASREAIW
ncbi:MAG: hypothetical protein ABF285_06170 [Pacificibacter sp.]|uniref:hypothetical protein n=1 Tax=Pacificibacter sp. TaxID=1917866 RepID=UPI003219AC94